MVWTGTLHCVVFGRRDQTKNWRKIDLDIRSDHDWIETSMSKPAFFIYTALALTFWQIGDSHGQEPRAKTLNISNVLRGIWFHRHTSAANSAWVGHMWQYSFVSLQNTTKLQPTNVQVCFTSPTLYLSIFPLLRPHNAEIEYLNIVAWMSETLVGIVGGHRRGFPLMDLWRSLH